MNLGHQAKKWNKEKIMMESNKCIVSKVELSSANYICIQ